VDMRLSIVRQIMIGMNDSREKGRPVDYSPMARTVIEDFRITLTENPEPLGKVKFTIDDLKIKRQKWDYKTIRCKYCDRAHSDTEQHCRLWYENHLHMSHGNRFPVDHPLFRPTRARKLMTWLEEDATNSTDS